jgi:NADPH2:quinone reductase
VVAPAASLVRVPDAVPDEIAAGAMLQGMTAHYLAHGVRTTRPGDRALVHAAAGGAGLLLVQTLARAGARVIGTCSTPEKAALAREAGADTVILYGKQDFAKAAREATDGRGVDVVYDSVGRDTFEGSLASLRPRGLLVLFGQSSGVVPPFDRMPFTPLACGSLRGRASRLRRAMERIRVAAASGSGLNSYQHALARLR